MAFSLMHVCLQMDQNECLINIISVFMFINYTPISFVFPFFFNKKTMDKKTMERPEAHEKQRTTN